MKLWQKILLVFIILFSADDLLSEDVFVFPNSAEEGIFSLRYSYFRYDMIVYLHNDSLYLPLTGILSNLKIYYQYNNNTHRISGFFVSPDTNYVIDLVNKTAVINKRQVSFNQEDFLVSEMEVYVTPSFLTKVFNFEMIVLDYDLSVYLRSRSDLPILSQHRRRQDYSLINTDSRQKFAPLLYGRNRSWLNGGIMDYQMNVRQALDQRTYNYGLNAGLEVLGGDLQGYSYGTYQEQTKDFNHRLNYRWRYYFGDNPYLTQFSAGHLNTSSFRTNTIQAQRIRGVQISNEVTQLPLYFANHLIEDRIEPGWQVELYVNGQLLDQTVTDPTGYYMFNVPVNYGNTNIQMKYYGTNGEYIDNRDVVVVPSEFLQPGELKYNISAGEREIDTVLISEGRISFGLTKWLSNTFSIDRTFNELYDKTYYNNHLAMRVGNNIITSFDYYSERLMKGNLMTYYPNYVTASLSYTHFNGESDLNRSGMLRRMDANIGLPRLFSLPVNLIIFGNRSEFENITTNMFNANMFVNISPFFLNLRYYGFFNQFQNTNNFGHNCVADVSFNWFRKPKFLSYLNNTRIRGYADYNLTTKQLNSYGASLEQNILRWAILSVNWNHNVFSNLNTLSTGLVINMPSIQTNTNTSHISDVNIYSMGIQGTVGLNSSTGELHFNNQLNQNAVGYGAASFNFFLDENNNGIRDEDEQVIRNIGVSIPNGMMERTSDGRPSKAYNLTPYGRFNVIVNKETITNPLWVPQSTHFSIIADPNSYKSIDVPLYVAGVVEGNVYRNNGKSISGQPGIKVHIMSKDSLFKDEVPVFSDGSFYKLGVPPGEYVAWVDSAQMALIKAKPDIEQLEFVIEKTTYGDFVSDLNFEIKTKEYFAMKEAEAAALSQVTPIESKEFAAEADDELTAAASSETTEPEETVTEEITRQTQKINPNEVKRILFAGANAVTIQNDMLSYLDGLVEYLQANRTSNVSVVGHTDNVSDAATNMQISVRRAEAIKNYLVSKGIAANRVLTRGQGALYPIMSNATPDGRRQNRRVEITVIR